MKEFIGDMDNYTEFLKIIKELSMEYGFFTVSLTLTFCAVVIICAMRLPAIIDSLAKLKNKHSEDN